MNLAPWTRRNVPAKTEEPFYSLQREMNKLFEDFLGGNAFELSDIENGLSGTFNPKVELKETDKELIVTAELPGLTDKDVEVSLAENAIVISGEKKEEKESNTKGYYRMERTYGSFRRAVPMPCEVDRDKIAATFNHGLLTVRLPKTPATADKTKKIEIKKN